MSALEIQYEYLNRAKDFTSSSGLDADSASGCWQMWQRRASRRSSTGNLDKIAREIDWVTSASRGPLAA